MAEILSYTKNCDSENDLKEFIKFLVDSYDTEEEYLRISNKLNETYGGNWNILLAEGEAGMLIILSDTENNKIICVCQDYYNLISL